MVVPPIMNLSSSEETDDNDVAFKVLNQDNLPMAVVGESLLKPFGRENQKQKPNVIVYPTRRVPNALEENKTKSFTKSNGCINDRNGGPHMKKKLSHSHGNLDHYNNPASKTKPEEAALDKSFTKTLDAKLRKLQKEEKNKRTEQQKKPLFVTTVKKGTFLQPPPELASLFGFRIEEEMRKDDKKLYAYASKPRVLNRSNNVNKTGHKNRCDAAAKAAAVIASNVAGIQPNLEIIKDVNSNFTRKTR